MTVSSIALCALLSLAGSTSPTEPAELPELPEGLEQAPWEAFYVHQCKERVEATGMRQYRFLKQGPIRRKTLRGYDDIFCHVPQAVLIRRGPTGLHYWGYIKVNCAMALAMARFEAVAQEVGEAVFERERPIKAIRHLGTVNCRRLRDRPETQSQHSFGNAIDVASFRVKRYGMVDVKLHWNTKLRSKQRHRTFLRQLAERLRDDEVFSVVLDADFGRGHRNHFHLALKPQPWFDLQRYTGTAPDAAQPPPTPPPAKPAERAQEHTVGSPDA